MSEIIIYSIHMLLLLLYFSGVKKVANFEVIYIKPIFEIMKDLSFISLNFRLKKLVTEGICDISTCNATHFTRHIPVDLNLFLTEHIFKGAL